MMMIHDARERERCRGRLSRSQKALLPYALLLLVVVVVFARSIIDGRHYYCKDERKMNWKKMKAIFSGQKFSQ